MKGIAKCTQLKSLTLYLSNSDISSDGVRFIGEGIAKCTQLTKLSIDYS